jgi:hypothetical protein
MEVPPEQAATLDKMIAAGKKLLYSEQLAPEITKMLEGEGPVGPKIGEGVVLLLGLLMERANGTLPPQLLIPAGVALVAEAGDMLEEAGVEVEDNDVAEGMAAFIEGLLARAGIDEAKIAEIVAQQGGGQPPAEPQPPAAPAAPQPPAAPAAPPGV